MSKQILIAGGGASGLSAAIAAAECGAQVTILERLPRVGKKILATGNGRCNLGHAGKELAHYHGTLPQAKQILQQFDTVRFFRKLGVLTRTDSEGRQYPCSGAAASVLDALRLACERLGVSICCDTKLTALSQQGGRWIAECENARYSADAVILAAGGSASPVNGTDGNLLPMLERMGHRIITPLPALCPIPTNPNLVRSLKGMRVQAMASAIVEGKIRKQERGEVQFTETALSGICIFNLSRLAAVYGDRMTVSLNLLPDRTAQEATQLLSELIALYADAEADYLLIGLLPKRVGAVCIKQALGKAQGSIGALFASSKAREQLLRQLTDWRFPVAAMASFAQAQVTAGGISGQSVDRNLESRCAKGLYFCGELLDLDGDCGGYNLDWAWASGSYVGKAAAQNA